MEKIRSVSKIIQRQILFLFCFTLQVSLFTHMEDIVTFLRLQSLSGARTGQTPLGERAPFPQGSGRGREERAGLKFSVSSGSEVPQEAQPGLGVQRPSSKRHG